MFILMNISIAEIVRRRRKELGVDQRTLAELAEVSVHTISDIESGKGNPKIETLESILDVLGLQLRIDPRGVER